jgi:uncharacterized protein (TIGR04141 family)
MRTTVRAKAHHLTIRLIKEGLKMESALSLKLQPYLKKFNLRNGFDGAVYVSESTPKSPKWLDFINKYSDESLELKSVNSKAVMFIKIENRIFAITFGQGYYLLSPDSFENDFGLKVALNAIDADKLRSIDAKTIDERTINTRRQTSKLTPFESFGFDVRRDLLRAATGEPRDRGLAERLTGADGLSICVKFKYEEIADKCKQLLEEYKKETYKKRFSCFDHLRPVKDKNLMVILDNLMLEHIQSKKVENLFLAPPEIIEFKNCNGFRFSGGGEEYSKDLKIEDYWKLFKNPKEISLGDLHGMDVIMDENGFDQKWPVYKCLVFEIKNEGDLYVIIEGKWFKISNDFCKDIDDELSKIEESDVDLPKANNNEREEDYNKRAAKENGSLVLMDQKNIFFGGGQSKIEVCDLFANKKFIHVKKRTSSATLSHLFSQGRISAVNFVHSEIFRNKVKLIIEKENKAMSHCIPSGRPKFKDFDVVYAIITSVTEKDWRYQIPFFSRLNLVEAYRELTDLGYNVLIKKIEKEQ